MKTATENLMDWRQFEPLVKTQAQLGVLSDRVTDLTSTRSAASGSYDAATAALADQEAREVLGTATAAEVRAARIEADTTRTALADLDAELTKVSHASELLECEIPALEAEAKARVQAAYHAEYRPAVKRLLDAVRAASEANAEVEGILRAAGVDFGDNYTVQYDLHFPRFLPNLVRRDLRLTPPGVYGDCELVRWEKLATEYIGGNNEHTT